jgi:hypothetical protein
MQIHLRGGHRSVTEKVSDHVDAAPCISGVAAERVPELMLRASPGGFGRQTVAW